MEKYIKNIEIAICDNTCLNITLTDAGVELLKPFFPETANFSGSYYGEGIENGHISVQYPVTADSHAYVFGDDIEDSENEDEFLDIVYEIINIADDNFDRRDYEFERLFDTTEINFHDSIVEHGYYNNMNLQLLENDMTKEAYVIFSVNAQHTIFEDEFKTFSDVTAAKKYIRENIRDDETLQDFSISYRIYEDIHEGIHEY